MIYSLDVGSRSSSPQPQKEVGHPFCSDDEMSIRFIGLWMLLMVCCVAGCHSDDENGARYPGFGQHDVRGIFVSHVSDKQVAIPEQELDLVRGILDRTISPQTRFAFKMKGNVHCSILVRCKSGDYSLRLFDTPKALDFKQKGKTTFYSLAAADHATLIRVIDRVLAPL